jgi:secondary thiamine-phosphate synthase enzyme
MDMKIFSEILAVDSPGSFSVMNITPKVLDFIESTGIQNGQVVVYYKHTTGSIIIGEHEPGIIIDLQEMFEIISPISKEYKHHLRAVDYNGHAHLRAAVMPTSVVIPVIKGELALGTHQEILVIDNQNEALERFVLLQAMGD